MEKEFSFSDQIPEGKKIGLKMKGQESVYCLIDDLNYVKPINKKEVRSNLEMITILGEGKTHVFTDIGNSEDAIRNASREIYSQLVESRNKQEAEK
jgi:hypothetical protein